MFACMAGAAPQPADQRKLEDKMEPHLAKLQNAYSPELVAMVRSCLAMDPLARPQSVFAVQKVLQTAMPAPPPAGAADKLSGQWRSLVDRIGGLGRKKTADKT
jgi:hypothetical protein